MENSSFISKCSSSNAYEELLARQTPKQSERSNQIMPTNLSRFCQKPTKNSKLSTGRIKNADDVVFPTMELQTTLPNESICASKCIEANKIKQKRRHRLRVIHILENSMKLNRSKDQFASSKKQSQPQTCRSVIEPTFRKLDRKDRYRDNTVATNKKLAKVRTQNFNQKSLKYKTIQKNETAQTKEHSQTSSQSKIETFTKRDPMPQEQLLKALECTSTLKQVIYMQGALILQKAKIYTYQLLQTGVCHRNISSTCIQMCGNNLILGGFGAAKRIPEIRSTLVIGNSQNKAPEVILKKSNISEKIDIWAVGCVMVEMITGSNMFHSRRSLEETLVRIIKLRGSLSDEELATNNLQSRAILQNWRLPKNLKPLSWGQILSQTCMDANLSQLLDNLFHYNPSQRISAKDALQHAYFQEFRNNQNYQHIKQKYKLDDNMLALEDGRLQLVYRQAAESIGRGRKGTQRAEGAGLAREQN